MIYQEIDKMILNQWFSIFLVRRPKFPQKNLSRPTWFHFSKSSYKKLNLFITFIGIYYLIIL